VTKRLRPASLCGPRAWTQAETARNRLPRLTVDRQPMHARHLDLVIACSGGVRSASFCLGALQLLNKTGHYRRADAVVGVSGGGTWRLPSTQPAGGRTTDPDDQETWPAEVGQDLFSQSSPEQHWLRRNTATG
jgi:hypothetical protein